MGSSSPRLAALFLAVCALAQDQCPAGFRLPNRPTISVELAYSIEECGQACSASLDSCQGFEFGRAPAGPQLACLLYDSASAVGVRDSPSTPCVLVLRQTGANASTDLEPGSVGGEGPCPVGYVVPPRPIILLVAASCIDDCAQECRERPDSCHGFEYGTPPGRQQSSCALYDSAGAVGLRDSPFTPCVDSLEQALPDQCPAGYTFPTRPTISEEQADSIDDCAQACSASPDSCRGFEFGRAPGGPQLACLLYDSASAVGVRDSPFTPCVLVQGHAGTNASTGLEPVGVDPEGPCPAGYTPANRPSSILMVASSIDECAQSCRERPDSSCHGFEYGTPPGAQQSACSLYDSAGAVGLRDTGVTPCVDDTEQVLPLAVPPL